MSYIRKPWQLPRAPDLFYPDEGWGTFTNEDYLLSRYTKRPRDDRLDTPQNVIDSMLPYGGVWDDLRDSKLYTALMPFDTNLWTLTHTNVEEITEVHQNCLDNCQGEWTSLLAWNESCIFRFTSPDDLVWFKLAYSERMVERTDDRDRFYCAFSIPVSYQSAYKYKTAIDAIPEYPPRDIQRMHDEVRDWFCVGQRGDFQIEPFWQGVRVGTTTLYDAQVMAAYLIPKITGQRPFQP